MTESQLVSHYALWALVVGLSVVVLVLTRQVGILHERIAPAGALALSSGPVVGEPAPQVDAHALDGTRVRFGPEAERLTSQLLFFVSPRCTVCRELQPVVRSIATRNHVRLTFASDGDELDHDSFIASHQIDRGDYVVSEELGTQFGIAKLPYAVLIDEHGIVRAQGLVNTREHVESLFEAQELGVGSVQDYLQGKDQRSDSKEVHAHGLA
jgi:methylamine dehydrogenase accessory protein MauD